MAYLSIIVPVYNAEKYLSHCIDSILAQTLQDFELILVDDGSTDLSGKICDSYSQSDSRVKVIHKENGGVSKARNVGITAASGDWLGFVDADDWLAPAMYDKMRQIAINSKADIVYCDFFAVKKYETAPVTQPEHSGDNLSLVKSFIMRGWTVVWNLLIRRNLVVANNLKFNEKIKFGEDFVFLLEGLLLAKKIDKIAEPLYYYNRINENSALNTVSFDCYKSVLEAIVTVREFTYERIVDPELEKMFGWKILQAKQDLVLYPDKHKEFVELYPEVHKHIMSCPWLNHRIKLMMWMLTHRMKIVVRFVNNLRFIMKGSIHKY